MDMNSSYFPPNIWISNKMFSYIFDIKMFLDNSNIDGGKIQTMETESFRNIQFFFWKK